MGRHVVRVEEKRVCKKALESEREGPRPRKLYKEEFAEDVKILLGIRRWKGAAMGDCRGRKLRDATARRGLEHHGVCVCV